MDSWVLSQGSDTGERNRIHFKYQVFKGLQQAEQVIWRGRRDDFKPLKLHRFLYFGSQVFLIRRTIVSTDLSSSGYPILILIATWVKVGCL